MDDIYFTIIQRDNGRSPYVGRLVLLLLGYLVGLRVSAFIFFLMTHSATRDALIVVDGIGNFLIFTLGDGILDLDE